tara:strand:- start:651 stop:887 length:237 start_codon:yes stop_codon:yes gene_type:complete
MKEVKPEITLRKVLSSMGEYHRIAEELINLQSKLILTTDEYEIDSKSYERGYIDGLAFAVGIKTEKRKERKKINGNTN